MIQNKVDQKKICLLGDFAVGKTSLVRRFVSSIFDEKYLSTIGVTISHKFMPVSGERQIQMIIWDLSGSDEFNGHRTSYLRGAAGAFLVCDLTRQETMLSLNGYREQLEHVSPGAATIVIGNKFDLSHSPAEDEKRIAKTANDLSSDYFLTSAKTGYNVENGFQFLARLISRED